MDEHKFYNALNIFYKGNYLKLNQALRETSSWQRAWQKIKSQTNIEVEAAWNKLKNSGINLILFSEKEFPEFLKEIPCPPLGIYWQGAPLDNHPKIAIVGTRKATLSGRNIAREFASKINSHNIIIVSGLALGIDAAVHQGVVENSGKTIAVLANGLDYIYPRQHQNLFKKILEKGGTIISEFASGPPLYPSRFLERNRIISGLSLGVVIIEAPINSGALTTARFAVEQNREVFVVPGAINQVNYIGSHNLIKSGAQLITSPDEVLLALNLVRQSTDNNLSKKLNLLDENQKAIVKVLEEVGQALSIDKIQELTKINISAVNQAVSLLQIQDIIKEENGQYYLS